MYCKKEGGELLYYMKQYRRTGSVFLHWVLAGMINHRFGWMISTNDTGVGSRAI